MTESGRLLVAAIHAALAQILASARPADQQGKLERTKHRLLSVSRYKDNFRRLLLELLSNAQGVDALKGDAKWQVWALIEEHWELARDVTLFALGSFQHGQGTTLAPQEALQSMPAEGGRS